MDIALGYWVHARVESVALRSAMALDQFRRAWGFRWRVGRYLENIWSKRGRGQWEEHQYK